MNTTAEGKIIKTMSALYTVRLLSPAPGLPEFINCPARGVFRHTGEKPLVGDNVELSVSNDTGNADKKDGDFIITRLLSRRNSLIRPPIANIDILFVMMAAAAPEPVLLTIDKLISVAEYNKIEPVIIIGKADLAPEYADTLADIYRRGGFSVFTISNTNGLGTELLKEYIDRELRAKTAAFAGASGIGKSTLLNTLFPSLALATGGISRRIERGKNTTRHVELFPAGSDNSGYIADTPGFGILDFEEFDFFGKDDLCGTMREFDEYLGLCRYNDCAHLKEEGCAVIEAVRNGKIAKSRHDSYVEMYGTLKRKKTW